MLIGDPVPVTRRWGDRKWPEFQSIVAGKDDEGYVDKSLILTRYTSMATAFFSISDIILMPHKNPGIATSVARITWWGIPFIGGGLVYTSAVNMLANVRGKTDPVNHFWGGAAVGALLGKHSRSVLTGFVMGTGLGIIALFNKEFEIQGMYPSNFPKNKGTGGPFTHRHDYTMTRERRGYWARSQDQVPEVMRRGMYDKEVGRYSYAVRDRPE